MHLPSRRRGGFRRRADLVSPCDRFPNRREACATRDFRRGPVVDFCLVHDVACTNHHVHNPAGAIGGLWRDPTNERLSRATAATREPKPTFPEGSDDSRPMCVLCPSYVPRDRDEHRELHASLSNGACSLERTAPNTVVFESRVGRTSRPTGEHLLARLDPAKGEPRRGRYGSSFCSCAGPV